MTTYSRMVVTDLDGTLTRSDGTISIGNVKTLEGLGDRSVLRVVATGRNLKSASDFLAASFPIDYLIFSSGAGVFCWKTREILVAHNLPTASVKAIASQLTALDLDFFLHHPIPDNHRFFYRQSGKENLDFGRRIERLRAYGEALLETIPEAGSQFLVVDPRVDCGMLHTQLQAQFPELAVIRATSPIDHQSSWLEIFSPCVSKALAAEWVAGRYGLSRKNALSIGNDYNDCDLLEWAGNACLLANAPASLKSRFSVVSTNDEDGFSEAVMKWLANGH